MKPLLTVTDRAAQKVRNLLEQQHKDLGEYGLRVYIEGGGCAGFQYKFDLDNKKRDGDHVFEFNGVRVFMDKKSALYLAGSEVDYEETLMQSGFKVSNPNAASSCGCGVSFAM
ncbi:MAG: iron-sulfur cluster insertion protein ErpA [Myxococcales bacterium]|nr:iron-sulfur cluster insertion protein ErpA [Myxococcales bacterium]